MIRAVPLLVISSFVLAAADPPPPFNGKHLDGWEVIGDGQSLSGPAPFGQHLPRYHFETVCRS
jgi:hypothetical protein